MAIQLLLKRSQPDALVMPLDTDDERAFAEGVRKHLDQQSSLTKWIGVRTEPADQQGWTAPIPCDAIVARPYAPDAVLSALDEMFNTPTVGM